MIFGVIDSKLQLSQTLHKQSPIVKMTKSLNKLDGLPPIQVTALIYIVLQHEDLIKRNGKVTTENVTKKLKTTHQETMKIIDTFRRHGLVRLDRRMSAGPSGHGYDGELFGTLVPSTHCIRIVRNYLKLP